MVDPVIMQPEFQESVLFFSLEVPQIQFMIRVLDIPVVFRVVALVVDLQWHVQDWFCRLRCISPLCSFCLSAGPRYWHHGFCGFQEMAALVVDNRSGMFYAGFTGNETPCSVFPVCRQAVMPGITVGMFLLVVAPVVRSDRCHGFCRCEHAATSSSSPF